MEFVFAYGAGLLTLINPCVLPVLPIVLASSLRTHKHGPLALASGLSLAFVTLGMGVALFGSSIGLDTERVSEIGAYMMIAFGVVLLLPPLGALFTKATSGFASKADGKLETLNASSLKGQFVGGIILGAVWSPCVGPTLGGAIALAYQGEDLLFAAAIMAAFALGISSIILLLGYGARETIRKRAGAMRILASRAKPIMGATFVLVGIMILTKFHYVIEAWMLDILPIWLQDLSVSI